MVEKYQSRIFPCGAEGQNGNLGPKCLFLAPYIALYVDTYFCIISYQLNKYHFDFIGKNVKIIF
jgi:hypothetical protein